MEQKYEVKLAQSIIEATNVLNCLITEYGVATNKRLTIGENYEEWTGYNTVCEDLISKMDMIIRRDTGDYGNGSIPVYDEEVMTFEVGKSYWSWLDFYDGAYSDEILIIGREGETLYAKHGDSIFRAYVDIDEGVEIAVVSWTDSNGVKYSGQIAADDMVE